MILDGRKAVKASGHVGRVTVMQALAKGDSVLALLWGSTLGCAAALTLLLSQKILDLDTAMGTVVEGMKEVIEPIIVLALAWALGGIIQSTGTASFIAAALTSGGLPAWALPASTSILSYVISFATGSSFGTMGILFPLIGPLAWELGGGDQRLLTHCFGCVLGGSLFGNVFSPIAVTTIWTQLATLVPLTDHVRTAGPAAALVGGLCLLLGDLPVGRAVGAAAGRRLDYWAQSLVLRLIGAVPDKRLLAGSSVEVASSTIMLGDANRPDRRVAAHYPGGALQYQDPPSKGAGSAGPRLVDPSVRAVPSAPYTVLPHLLNGTPPPARRPAPCTSVATCVEIRSLRPRCESSRRPPRHRRDACSMAWRCRFLAARPSVGRALVDFICGHEPVHSIINLIWTRSTADCSHARSWKTSLTDAPCSLRSDVTSAMPPARSETSATKRTSLQSAASPDR